MSIRDAGKKGNEIETINRSRALFLLLFILLAIAHNNAHSCHAACLAVPSSVPHSVTGGSNFCFFQHSLVSCRAGCVLRCLLGQGEAGGGFALLLFGVEATVCQACGHMLQDAEGAQKYAHQAVLKIILFIQYGMLTMDGRWAGKGAERFMGALHVHVP